MYYQEFIRVKSTQLLQTAFRDICIMIRHLIVGVNCHDSTLCKQLQYTAVCTCLLAACALQVFLLILILQLWPI